jgi:hypothetical protein
LKNAPSTTNYVILGPGSMIGKEDAISEDRVHLSSGLCASNQASLYYIDVADFITLKS